MDLLSNQGTLNTVITGKRFFKSNFLTVSVFKMEPISFRNTYWNIYAWNNITSEIHNNPGGGKVAGSLDEVVSALSW